MFKVPSETQAASITKVVYLLRVAQDALALNSECTKKGDQLLNSECTECPL